MDWNPEEDYGLFDWKCASCSKDKPSDIRGFSLRKPGADRDVDDHIIVLVIQQRLCKAVFLSRRLKEYWEKIALPSIWCGSSGLMQKKISCELKSDG